MPTCEVQIVLKGISPLMMHKYPLVEIEGFDKKTAPEQAEFAAYRIPGTDELYVPGVAVQRALINGATYSKGKGRSTLQKAAAACMVVTEEYLGLGTKTYTIDSRPVVIPATRGRVIRHRPRLDQWKISFTLLYEDTLLSEKNVREIVDNMVSRVGLLEFRPEKKGPFGRAFVESFKTV